MRFFICTISLNTISDDDITEIWVQFENEEVWLSQRQMAELFGKDTDPSGFHLKKHLFIRRMGRTVNNRAFLCCSIRRENIYKKKYFASQFRSYYFRRLSGKFHASNPISSMDNLVIKRVSFNNMMIKVVINNKK